MMKRLLTILLALLILLSFSFTTSISAFAEDKNEVITLRISNCEEYIDLGDWNEVIDLDSGDIVGKNSMIVDFENWFYRTYNKRVKVEYSTFGTNEDLYNQITLGDEFDLVCPSDYMGMKMIDEGMLLPLSKEFFDETDKNNYYINGVSPYIKDLMDNTTIGDESWSKYSAGYMWGTMGFVYNPDVVTNEEASTWKLFENTKFSRQLTVKDSIRDTYFGVLGLIYADELSTDEFKNSKDYNQRITEVMNDTSVETVNKAEKELQKIKENVYSFETDSGKADMVSGKVSVNFQWSGDAVYTLDQAEEDDCYFEFAVPEESSNLWCDGWVMLKDGIGGNKDKQLAAEAFINFLSRPDNVVRNMYYIGYTSCISGGDDDTILDYINWCYAAEDDEEDTVNYPLGFFFTRDNNDKKYVIKTTEDQTRRQLYAQYPTEDVLNRCAVMMFFDDDANTRINQMWINIRCFNLATVSNYVWISFCAFVLIIALIIFLFKSRGRIFRKRIPKGYKKV